MKYLCMIYNEESKLAAMQPRDFESFCIEHLAYEELLEETGSFIVAEALQPVQTAATVRVRNGRVAVTDGPFAETREQLGGFFLLEARDLNDAIRMAARIPSARLGCVEVRPVREIRPTAALADRITTFAREHRR